MDFQVFQVDSHPDVINPIVALDEQQADSDADDQLECELDQTATSSATACSAANRSNVRRSNKQLCLDLMRDIKKNTSMAESSLTYVTRKFGQMLLDLRSAGRLNLEFINDFNKYAGSCYYLNKEQISSNNILIKEFQLSNGVQQPFYRISFRYIIEQLISHQKLLDLILKQSNRKFVLEFEVASRLSTRSNRLIFKLDRDWIGSTF